MSEDHPGARFARVAENARLNPPTQDEVNRAVVERLGDYVDAIYKQAVAIVWLQERIQVLEETTGLEAPLHPLAEEEQSYDEPIFSDQASKPITWIVDGVD